MKINLLALFDDFNKQGYDVDSREAALELIESQYDFSKEELNDLHEVCRELIRENVDYPRVYKKTPELYDGIFSVIISSFFFGMFVANSEFWKATAKR